MKKLKPVILKAMGRRGYIAAHAGIVYNRSKPSQMEIRFIFNNAALLDKDLRNISPLKGNSVTSLIHNGLIVIDEMRRLMRPADAPPEYRVKFVLTEKGRIAAEKLIESESSNES